LNPNSQNAIFNRCVVTAELEPRIFSRSDQLEIQGDKMRKILIVALGLASLAAMTGTASAYINVSHDELQASCAKAGGKFEETDKGYSCDSTRAGKPIHIICSNNGNCISYNNSVFNPNSSKHANPSGNPVSTLGNAGGTSGVGKASTVGSTSGANSALAVGGLSSNRPAATKNASGNIAGNPGATVGSGGSLFSHDRPNFRQQ
jgi:hypothetical protein